MRTNTFSETVVARSRSQLKVQRCLVLTILGLALAATSSFPVRAAEQATADPRDDLLLLLYQAWTNVMAKVANKPTAEQLAAMKSAHQNTESASSLATMSAESYGCALWLDVARSTNNPSNVVVTLHNTIPGTNYQVLSKTNLADANWTTETNVTGAGGQDWTAVIIPKLGRSEVFFIAQEPRSYVLETNFSGLEFSFEPFINPPDTMGAVGPDHFVELINGSIAVFDKTTGAKIEEADSRDFFTVGSHPTGVRMVDPRILYDHEAQQWVACAIDALGTWDVILAVTTNHSPLGLLTNWSKHVLSVHRAGFNSDFTTLGLDANGLYVTTLHRQLGGTPTNQGHTIVAIKKPDIFPGDLITNHFQIDTGINDLKVWTVQPAVNFDSIPTNAYAWLVAKGPPQLGSNYQGGAVLFRRLQWSNTTARLVDTDWQSTLIAPPANYRDYYDVDGTNILFRPFIGWLGAPQAGGATRIELGEVGSRLMHAVVRNGFLYTCHHVGLSGTNGTYSGNELGTNADRSAVQWLKFRVEAESLNYYKHGRVFDSASTNQAYYYFPSIAVNCAADMLLGFSGSSATNYIGAYYAWRASGGGSVEQPTLIKAGEGHFEESRFGDYSATVLDPEDQITFWTVQEYSRGEFDLWGTWISKVSRR